MPGQDQSPQPPEPPEEIRERLEEDAAAALDAATKQLHGLEAREQLQPHKPHGLYLTVPSVGNVLPVRVRNGTVEAHDHRGRSWSVPARMVDADATEIGPFPGSSLPALARGGAREVARSMMAEAARESADQLDGREPTAIADLAERTHELLGDAIAAAAIRPDPSPVVTFAPEPGQLARTIADLSEALERQRRMALAEQPPPPAPAGAVNVDALVTAVWNAVEEAPPTEAADAAAHVIRQAYA